jgi:hypothetical protein
MELTQERIRRTYSRMAPAEQARFLALLAHNLTVSARYWYPTEEDHLAPPGSLMAINELQHTVTGQLTKLLWDDDKRYPDDVFIDILFSMAQSSDVERHLIAAVGYSYRTIDAHTRGSEARGA